MTLLSAAGIRVLARLANQLTRSGRRLLLATGTGLARRALDAVRAGDTLELFESLDAAFATFLNSVRAAPSSGHEPHGLRSQVHDLQDKLATRPLIAQALGMLQERYGLSGTDEAHDVLRTASQRHNMKLRDLAAAFIRAKPPSRPDDPVWFPGRVRPPSPTITFADDQCDTDCPAFLDLVLATALRRMATTSGHVTLVDPVRGLITLRRHSGLPDALVAFFDAQGATELTCGAALRRKQRVVVRDLPGDPEVSAAGGALLAEAGVRGVQSTPLITPNGDCVGVVSTLHVEPDWTPDEDALAALDRIGVETGAWLAWHTRLTTLDALEEIHHLARTYADATR